MNADVEEERSEGDDGRSVTSNGISGEQVPVRGLLVAPYNIIRHIGCLERKGGNCTPARG
jgi:hypothetical protein